MDREWIDDKYRHCVRGKMDEQDNPRLEMLVDAEKSLKAASDSSCRHIALVTIEQSKGIARRLHEREAQVRGMKAELALLRAQLAARAPCPGPSTVRGSPLRFVCDGRVHLPEPVFCRKGVANGGGRMDLRERLSGRTDGCARTAFGLG